MFLRFSDFGVNPNTVPAYRVRARNEAAACELWDSADTLYAMLHERPSPAPGQTLYPSQQEREQPSMNQGAELDTLATRVWVANLLATDGRFGAGYRLLSTGLRRSKRALAAGAPGAEELLLGYRLAVEGYISRFGVRFD